MPRYHWSCYVLQVSGLGENRKAERLERADIDTFSGQLIAERFSGFQGVSDSLLGFALAAEADEGFAFQV
jgi:hypothetical protein